MIIIISNADDNNAYFVSFGWPVHKITNNDKTFTLSATSKNYAT